MRLARYVTWTLLLFFPVVRPLGAVTVESWTASSVADFAVGAFEGTAVDEGGRLRIAPEMETLWGPESGIVWDLAAGSRGSVFAALSSPGRLLHVTADGETSLWRSVGEDKLIAAVEVDGTGGVYFGQSPDGAVYHAESADRITVAAETGAKFVWSLAGSDDGSLWIGTGMPGSVLRLMPDGELIQVFDTDEDPVRCLVPLEGGGILVGTGRLGRVIRIDAAGRPFVLLDAEESEIVSILVGSDGNYYALAARSAKHLTRAPVQGAVQTVRVTANAPESDNGDNGQDDETKTTKQPSAAPRGFQTSSGAVLYRITPDGATRRLWESGSLIPFRLAEGREGRMLVATGDAGRIYEIDERGREAVVHTIASDQVSAMVAGHGGRLFFGGTSDARVEAAGPRLRPAASYLTFPIDAGAVADWGRLAWDAEVPRGAELNVYARAGNTSEPDDTWSDWVAVTSTDGTGEGDPELPSTRWIQIRIDMQPGRSDEGPLLSRLAVFYRQHNRRPVIESVDVQPAGVVWTITPSPSTRSRGPLVADDPVARKAAANLTGVSVARPIRKSYELGARTVSWDASDPDGDRLIFAVEIRREGEQAWIPLEREVRAKHLNFDTRGLPDGFYRARLRAADTPDNPDRRGLEDLATSRVFQIDNTRPTLVDRDVRRADDGYAIEFMASDPGGNVVSVEVAVDGGEWQPLDPLDGVADSSEEHYEMRIEADATAAPNARTVRIRVIDAAGNLGGDAWALDDPRP